MGTRALRGHWRDGRVRSSTGPALIASQTFSQARTRSEEGLVGLAPPRSPALGSERHDTTGGRERPPFSFFGSLPGGPAELTKNLVSSVGFFCRKKNWIPRKFLTSGEAHAGECQTLLLYRDTPRRQPREKKRFLECHVILPDRIKQEVILSSNAAIDWIWIVGRA